jgi:ParB family chromosome partitioning protein
LIENIQRHDLNALEEAQAYQQLMHELALTHEQVATRVGKSRSAISNTMRLLELPDRGQQLLIEGKISEGHARAILGLKVAEDQLITLETVLADGLSVRQTEELIRRINEKQTTPPKPVEKPEKSKDTKVFESKLRGALGTKVSLNRNRKGGKIIIEFFSDEEFESIYEHIVRDAN